MVRYRQYIPFVVSEFESDIWNHPPHNHNHFEIVLINKGKGMHSINNIKFNYKENDIFLLAPEDYHYFEVEKRTSFCYFKFTEHLFNKDGNIQDKNKWMQKVESILLRPNLIPGTIKYDQRDKEKIIQLADIIRYENGNPNCYNDEIIADSMGVIISLIARNICKSYSENQINKPVKSDRVNEILTYIRQNVYNNNLIKIDALAEHFNMSKNYISIFFKKHTGEPLQQCIMNYRIKLVENRLLRSDFTVTEIAYQLGFTDESHLIRLFKKHYGKSPGEFRKEHFQKTHKTLIN